MNDDDLTLTRRNAIGALGVGLLVAVGATDADAQQTNAGARAGTGERGDQSGRKRPPANVAARLHLGADGLITVMTGKVECGQGARAQITQAVAEELRIAPAQVRVVMGDTDLCPDDGPTVGSRTTPSTIPAVRRGAAAAREALASLAAKRWGVEGDAVEVRDGNVRHEQKNRTVAFADLAGDDWSRVAAETEVPEGIQLTPIKTWSVLGQSFERPNGRDIVVGTHRYPSDIDRPSMLYGQVLRPPALGSTLEAIDLDVAKGRDSDVVVTRAGDFVGVAAPKLYLARRAIDALAQSAKWNARPPVDFDRLYEHLRSTAREPEKLENPFAEEGEPARSLRQEYRVAYVQHVPLEPRAAVAEWDADGKLTVWTATQNPMRVREELGKALDLSPQQVRVIVPDFGGAFGGKHTGECAIEAARIARAAKRPVSLRWTRDEEFQWASFRPAALIPIEATLADDGSITSWFHVNVNSGGSGLRSPYRSTAKHEAYVESSDPPLRHGSYRALAATANHFARETFIDELAELAKIEPLAFRLRHLDESRMIDVLNAAAKRFDWATRSTMKSAARGVGIACGTEKGSFVATCAEVAIDARTRAITVTDICTAYECGKIMNPSGLTAQVQGALVQGLGPALWEAIDLRGGVVTNGRLSDYRVPRFSDVPPRLELVLLDRPDLPSVGAGETPIVAIAPAIANAVWHATGQRCRSMPIKLDAN